MPNENGFELLKSLDPSSFSVIFITAYNQYAIKAIRANALDYLLKPIDTEELVNAVRKALQVRNFSNNDIRVTNLVSQISNKTSKITSITLPLNDGYKFISLSEVVYFEASNNYTKIYLDNCKNYLVSKTLKEISEMLDSNEFLRVHKSYVVQMSKVVGFTRNDGLQLELQCGNTLPVSRRKQSEFLNQIKIR